MGEVSHYRRHVEISPRTCTSTLAIGFETGYVDAIEVVGADSRLGEEGESGKEWQIHHSGVEELV